MTKDVRRHVRVKLCQGKYICLDICPLPLWQKKSHYMCGNPYFNIFTCSCFRLAPRLTENRVHGTVGAGTVPVRLTESPVFLPRVPVNCSLTEPTSL